MGYNMPLSKFYRRFALLLTSATISANLWAGEVRVLAPANYLSPDFLENIAPKSDVTYYYDESSRESLLASTDRYDVVIVSEKSAVELARNGQLKNLSTDLVAVDSDELSGIAIQLSYSALGIAYRNGNPPPSTWADFFGLPAKELGRVAVPVGYSDVIDAALIATGVSTQHFTDADLVTANLLIMGFAEKLKPMFYSNLRDPQLQNADYILTNASHARQMQLDGLDVSFVYPGNLTRIRRHYIGITQHGNSDAASSFVDAINSVNGAIAQTQYHGFPITNERSIAQLRDSPSWGEQFNYLTPSIQIEREHSYNNWLEKRKAYLYERVINAAQ